LIGLIESGSAGNDASLHESAQVRHANPPKLNFDNRCDL
jgi:hypothetical protein